MRRLLFILISIIYLSCGVKARERTDSAASSVADGGPLVVSLVTCAPGPDVYELCGHAAIRIRNAEMDSVWNYGIFDFSSPNFLYRFVKGETDYMVRGYDFARFMPAYVMRGSEVIEQTLDLSQEEARDLRRRLSTEALPQNRIYRYNYVRDNCATRPWKRVMQAAPLIALPDTLLFPTFRKEMSHFHRNYPWYRFGIDLVLGSGLDYPLAKDEDIFAPPVLAAKVAQATIGESASGDSTLGRRPLVTGTSVIYPGRGDVTLPPTSPFLTPMAAGIVTLLISFGALFAYLKRNQVWRLWITLYFAAAGIAGIIVAFLVFFSEHEAVRPNILILWLNPLQLAVAAAIWIKSACRLLSVVSWYEISISILIPVLCLTGLFPQYLNAATYPFLLSLIPLSLIFIRYNTNKS